MQIVYEEGGNLESFASEWVDIGYVLYVTGKKKSIETLKGNAITN